MDLDGFISELIPFLSASCPERVRSAATEQLLGLSASEESRGLLKQREDLLDALVLLTGDEVTTIQGNAIRSVVNLSSDKDLNGRLLSIADGKLVKELARVALATGPETTEAACMALSNLTRSLPGCEVVWKRLQSDFEGLDRLVPLLSRDDPNVDHLALVLCNLSQVDDVRRALLDSEKNHLKQILGIVSYPKSSVRRKGVVATIRNCCFDSEYHERLLSQDIDILPILALPLAGSEEFDDDVNDKLPLELQYLGDDKVREEEPDIRLMLIEAMTQLCATKHGRCFIRDKQIYYVLRELHKWEKSKKVSVACENLVDILIGDEPQPGMDNLKEVEIPSDLEEKFRKIDETLLADDT